MTTLKTNYLRLILKNPIIVGASEISNSIDNLKRLEEAGAAAIVYKSLFEEQIQLERAQLKDELEEYNDRFPEMATLFPAIRHAGPEEHLINLRKAKESLSIPLIASLNAVYKETWVEYAKLIQQTGVDGLELNFYTVPRDFEIDSSAIEKQQLTILKAIRKNVSIPISVKLSPYYTNILSFVRELDAAGADGIVLFNRLYQPDISIYKEQHVVSHNLSSPLENRLPMRFAGLLYDNIDAPVCCNSGIHEGEDVIKMILAGASCVQVVSTIYKNKIPHIHRMIIDMMMWMEEKGYKLIDDFKGKLSKTELKDPFVYQRAQYIEMLLRSGELMEKPTLR